MVRRSSTGDDGEEVGVLADRVVPRDVTSSLAPRVSLAVANDADDMPALADMSPAQLSTELL